MEERVASLALVRRVLAVELEAVERSTALPRNMWKGVGPLIARPRAFEVRRISWNRLKSTAASGTLEGKCEGRETFIR